jgi:hypothetical protein
LFGGDLNVEPDFRQKFISEGDPRKRGYVIRGGHGGDTVFSDLTIPVAWAMGIETPT